MINNKDELQKIIAWMRDINCQYDRAEWFKEKYNLEKVALEADCMWKVTEFNIIATGIKVNRLIWLDEKESPRETSFDNGWKISETWEFPFTDYRNAKELIEAAEQEINDYVNEIKKWEEIIANNKK